MAGFALAQRGIEIDRRGLVSSAANVVSQFALNVFNYGAKGDGVTDDAAAITAAVAAAAPKIPSNGVVDIWLPGGFEYLLGPISLTTSGVRFWCNGAGIIPNLPAMGVLPLIRVPSGGNVNRLELHGGSFLGTGSEGQNNVVIEVTGNAQATDVVVDGIYVKGWTTGPVQLYNVTRAKVKDCTMLGVGGTGALNAINFVSQTPLFATTQKCMAYGNMVETSEGGCIAWVNVGTATTMDTQFKATNNICVQSSTTGKHAILVEVDNAGSNGGINQRASIIDNHITVVNAGGGAAVYANVSSSTAIHQMIKVDENNIVCNSSVTPFSFSSVSGADISANNNRVNAATQGTQYGLNNTTQHSGNKFSTGASQGRATLVAGTATVNTAEIQSGDNVLLTVVSANGTRGEVQLGTITAGTSFVINSIQPGTTSTLQASDTSTVFWQIVH